MGADGLSVAAGRKPVPPLRYTPLSRNVARIPLMVHLPGMSRQRLRPIVQPRDVTATMLELFGVPVPEHVIGQSLLKLLGGERAAWHRKAAVLGGSVGPAKGSGFAQVMNATWMYTAWRGERSRLSIT